MPITQQMNVELNQKGCRFGKEIETSHLTVTVETDHCALRSFFDGLRDEDTLAPNNLCGVPRTRKRRLPADVLICAPMERKRNAVVDAIGAGAAPSGPLLGFQLNERGDHQRNAKK
jgi:hypothetical protein